MSKLDKLITLINLLHHRRRVTLEEIQNVCGISERTAYRYIESISRANIPVYFDKSIGGYRVDHRDSFRIEDLKASDAIFLLVATYLLSQRLNTDYNDEIEQLKKRLFSRLNFPLEELWECFKARIEQDLQAETLSDSITSLLIHASVINNKGLRLALNEGNLIGSVVEITTPALRFKGKWCVEGSSDENEKAIPINNIKRAEIV